MQKIQHIICGLLAVAMLTGGAVSASAATRIQHTDNSLIGDVDNNRSVNVSDATLLQKLLADYDGLGLNVEDYRTVKALDVNNDNNITIYDVTTIQRYLAEIPGGLTAKPISEHSPVIQTTMKETIVENAYTFKAGGEWVQHAFCKTCHKDLTIVYDKYCEEHPETKNDGLTYWAQTKHIHSEMVYSPVTGKLIKVNIDCQGTIWHKDFGNPFDKTKLGAVQEMVYIGGQEYTYPAITKRTYTQTTDGVVTKVWAEQLAYPNKNDIINGTYTEKWLPVDP